MLTAVIFKHRRICALHSSTARRTIRSNTGCVSPGEADIAFSTSIVADWCSIRRRIRCCAAPVLCASHSAQHLVLSASLVGAPKFCQFLVNCRAHHCLLRPRYISVAPTGLYTAAGGCWSDPGSKCERVHTHCSWLLRHIAYLPDRGYRGRRPMTALLLRCGRSCCSRCSPAHCLTHGRPIWIALTTKCRRWTKIALTA